MGKLETTGAFLAVLALLLFAGNSEASDYYTWIDENGVVNYSERNPQDYEARYISESSRFGYPAAFGSEQPETEAVDNSDDEAPSDEEQNNADIDAQIAQERARVDAEIAAAKRQNCTIGKRNLAQLEGYARIRITDDDGEERVLSDQEKAERIEKARQTIRENCTG